MGVWGCAAGDLFTSWNGVIGATEGCLLALLIPRSTRSQAGASVGGVLRRGSSPTGIVEDAHMDSNPPRPPPAAEVPGSW